MKSRLILMLMLMLWAFSPAARALAKPDLYVGDASLYSTGIGGARPNILLFIDNSAGMTQIATGQVYNPAVTYRGPGIYNTNAVYVRSSATGGTVNYTQYIGSIGSVTCSTAKTSLTTGGAYYGYLNKNGSCSAAQSGDYFTGNLVNYLFGSAWAPGVSFSAGDSIKVNGVTYVCSTPGTTGSTQPASWPTAVGSLVPDGSVVWTVPSTSSILTQVQQTLLNVLPGIRDSVNLGLALFGNDNHGAQIIMPISDVSQTTTGDSNYQTLVNDIKGITLLGGNLQPVDEALWDSGVYFRGQNSNTTMKINLSDTVPYPSPIKYSCQLNAVIALTTGNSPDTTKTIKKEPLDLDGSCSTSSSYNQYDCSAGSTNCTTCYGDVADVALYNDNPANNAVNGLNVPVMTNIIQLLTPTDIVKLKEAATSTTNYDQSKTGQYYHVYDSAGLADAILSMFVPIVSSLDTAFVAPVVPVSPENRTYSGNRVYMGFFKPMNSGSWRGNLKKYGISAQNYLTDQGGAQATWVDINGDGIDDITGETLPKPPNYTYTAVNGTFRSSATSFWTTTGADSGYVDKGGAGQVLHDTVYPNRHIYTYTGSSLSLTDGSNAFTTGNTALTPAMLGQTSLSDANNLINFVNGMDVKDEDKDGNFSDKRPWMFGDILHSRPVIVNYNSYTLANENTCPGQGNPYNGSVIYVGSDDGMLHAIRDCNGQEIWAFIPPDMLGHLSYLESDYHSYFVDGTPAVYTYNANNTGNINPNNGDKVILMFGEHRGGGVDSAPTSGSYYAMDVTDPAHPQLMWQINNQTTQTSSGTTTYPFSELAETWSDPKLVKMLIGGAVKIVAFVGAGYDNIHEDTRYGNVQSFTNASYVNLGDTGEGNVNSTPSTDASGLTSPKGRGIYAIEIATLDSTGKPDFTNSGQKIWGYTFANDPNMKFSIPSQLAAIDSKNSGYTDTLYVGDTGGQVWRLDVGDPSPANWTATRRYDLGHDASGAASGRKFFYMPSIVIESGYKMIFIGSGDREHPLNWDANLVDRIYALKDNGGTATLTEGNLWDVTTDQLQTSTTTTAITNTLSALTASSGWYIRLTYYDAGTGATSDLSAGEKVLASPLVFNQVAYFTTYTPNFEAIDPCKAGNLGVSKIYALDYKTGAAVLDYYVNNDTLTGYASNPYTATSAGILQRADRVQTIGAGIPSGIVLMIGAGGETKALVGVGGVIASLNPKKGGAIKPLYWRKK